LKKYDSLSVKSLHPQILKNLDLRYYNQIIRHGRTNIRCFYEKKPYVLYFPDKCGFFTEGFPKADAGFLLLRKWVLGFLIHPNYIQVLKIRHANTTFFINHKVTKDTTRGVLLLRALCGFVVYKNKSG